MSAVRALLRRDLLLALRAGGGAGQGLAFFVTIMLMIPLGIGPDNATLARIAPGTLWVAALLACLLSLERIFQADFEDGTLDILALSPMPLEAIVAVKMLAHWLTTGAALVVIAPLIGMMLGLPAAAILPLMGSLLIGTPALSALGAIGAALTVGLRRGGLLISVLTLPLYVPTLILGARMVSDAAAGRDFTPAMLLLSGLSLGIIALAPFVAALALRTQLR